MSKLEIDEDLVRKLSELIRDNELTEIEYESGDQKIRISRILQAAPAVQVAAAAPAAAPVAAAAPVSAAAEAPAADAIAAGAVTSPMVGTVYVASEPGATPFVKVGDTVTEGQTIAIIEAMKVMNQIPSPKAGTVTQVLIRDGQPIEFGEPLMVIE